MVLKFLLRFEGTSVWHEKKRRNRKWRRGVRRGWRKKEWRRNERTIQ